MDKFNENVRDKKQIKLDGINVTPILIALLLGFLVVGKRARHVDGQQQFLNASNKFQQFLSSCDDARLVDVIFC